MKTKDEEIRIQKFMSDKGILSRRKAEDEIRAGRILINGKIAVIGQKIIPGLDTIEFNKKTISVSEENNKIYVMLNKPAGYVTTLSDDKGRKCIAELIKDIGVRVYPCGRLDKESEGLLILTNDGELANKLTHPRHNISKIYHVYISSEITPEQVNALGQSMVIDNYEIEPVKVTVIVRKRGLTVIQMNLFEGRNRQIRKMCDLVGLKIIRLQRIAIGDITLGDLKQGKWRLLSISQINYLKGIKNYARNKSNSR